MNVMYSVAEYFVRLREDSSGRLKVTVWSKVGDKVVSDYISAASSPVVWANIAANSSDQVVESVKGKLFND